ncbi:MAG: gliding motility-associated C-terminal domain-containing protein [Cytophagaceae bacterium]|nr:gliding motility-associated C-terminal domain-containing protein [Cytophagaceae bacterium]
MKRILLLSLFLLNFFSIAFAQTPGTLDFSFNKTGNSLFALKVNSTDDYTTATLLQPDGKLLVSGYYNSSQDGEGFVTRWLANGKADPTFGTKGKVIIRDLGIPEFVANAMALQSNGNIVLAGHYYIGNNYSNPAIVCLKADGSINTELDSYGFKSFYNFSGGLATLNTVHIHPATGHIIACGQTNGLQNNSSMLIIGIDRFGNTFFDNALSYRTYHIGDKSSNITSAVQFHPDSLYLGVNQLNGGLNTMGITAASMTTGEINSQFGSADSVLLISSNFFSQTYCSSIGLTSTKDIILGGCGFDGVGSQFLVHKINTAKETTDPSFGNNGEKLIQFGSSTDQRASSLTVDVNDKIVLGGYYRALDDKSYWAAARLNSNGQPDPGFGTKTFSVEDNVGIVSMQALSTGEYVLAGTSNVPAVNSDVLIKKINNGGGDVLAYGKNSEVNSWAKDYKSTGQDLALRSDGKLWVCGILPTNTDLEKQSGIALLNADGTLDESFGGAGQAMPGVYIVPQMVNSKTLYGLQLTSLKIQGSKLLVAGTYFESSQFHLPILMRFIINGNTLTPDNTFGGNGTGIVTLSNGSYYNYVQGLVLQDNTNILVYGYFNSSNNPGVICYSKDGVISPTFAGASGMYTSVRSTSADGDVGKSMDLKSLSDNTMIGVTSSYSAVNGTEDFLVFKLAADGSETSDSMYNIAGKDNAYCLAIKPDKSFYVGGSSANQYTIVAIKADGNFDMDFGTNGKWSIPKGLSEAIVGLHIDGQKLLALGLSFDSDKGSFSRSVFRLTMAGKLDDTFYGKGYNLYGNGWAYNSIIANNRLYAIGPDRKLDGAESARAQVDKLYLGSGPVIKTTNLSLPNLVKTYGDAPFKLTPVTNSPAPITYTILNTFSVCATVNNEGLFTIGCATNSENHIQVKAYQPAISGYTEATAFSTMNINRAVPKIIFPKQGGLIGDTIVLKLVTNYDTNDYNFEQLTSNDAAQFIAFGTMVILAEGQEEVRVSFSGNSNFLSDTLRTTIYGYVNPIAPEANDDLAELVYGQSSSVTFNILENDAAYTGSLDAHYIDLDVTQPGLQFEYVSPALGLFQVDTSSGLVKYTPFLGFIGSGNINYSMRDSKGTLSNIGSIKVSVVLQGEKPALKATELFTPNNDGLNDAFVIGFVDLEQNNQLKIFDRNGAELFTQSNYKNDWNGDLPNGKKAENGIYYYLFTEGASEDQRESKGVVELRR